jgi:hypothetical protein
MPPHRKGELPDVPINYLKRAIAEIDAFAAKLALSRR